MTSSSIRASAPPTTCCATASRRRTRGRGRSAAPRARRVHRPARAQGAPHDRARGGTQAEPDRRPPPVRRAARTRQDHAGRHRRHRDGRPPARHVRAGVRARRRSRRDPHQARRRRRAVHRRDPSPVAGGRGDPVSGDGGLPDRHRRGQGTGGLEHPADDGAVHARRRHHPHRHDHGPAARPVRPRGAARLLRHQRTAGDRANGRRGSSTSRSTPTERGRSPAGREARRASPTGCCGACATSPRSAPTGSIDADVARDGLALFGVDDRGLDKVDRAILTALCVQFNGGPVGLSTVAISVGEQPETVEDMYEPFLITQGMIARTPRGRVALDAAYEHIGVPVPRRSGGASLFD